MQVEQAIFTSAQNSHLQGYHLVARSPKIDDQLAQTLTQWSPSHDALLSSDANATSLNVYQAGDDWVAISRTVYGGSEYSARGGLRLITIILLLNVEQFSAYHYDALLIGRTALSMGFLRNPSSLPEFLPTVELPDRSLFALTANSSQKPECDGVLQQVLHTLHCGGRAAVIGLEDPVSAVEKIVQNTPRHRRMQLSFTTGLKPSMHRPFGLQFLQTADAPLQQQLAAQGITCVEATNTLAESASL